MFNRKGFLFILGSGLIGLVLVGLLIAMPAFAQGGGMMGYGNGRAPGLGYGSGGMMGGSGYSSGGMMNGYGYGSGGMMGAGMMGPEMMGPEMMGVGMMFSPNNPFYVPATPLSLEQATATLEAYVAGLNDPNLIYDDLMVFDNHVYAQIIERDTDTGIMEVLVDPTTQAVYPEMGPNMMWNQKYHMMGNRMGGYNNGLMGNLNFGNPLIPPQMTINPEQALETAQNYLDTNFPNLMLSADDHADPFYGYYTLHVYQDGETVGMLSVNGYSGTVWPHTWHGELLTTSADH